MSNYHSSPGLSHSMMKDLAVSPLRFWSRHLDPNRKPEEPSKEMQFGSALHCGVFETAKFDSLYCLKFEAPEGCLDTVEDMRAWLTLRGHSAQGSKKKQDFINRILDLDSDAPILANMERDYELTHRGKTFFKREDWDRILGCAEALGREPGVMQLLEYGSPELSMYDSDIDTGVMLKAKSDWIASGFTVDLKTFSQQRGKSIDKCITDAIWYEGYYKQAWLYSYIRYLQEEAWLPFIMVFVESDPPHEVRIRQLEAGNIYWEQAGAEVRSLIRLYADCMEKYGPDKPWRSPQQITPLVDEELPQLAWSGFGGEVERREWPAKPEATLGQVDNLVNASLAKFVVANNLNTTEQRNEMSNTPVADDMASYLPVAAKLTEIRQWMNSQPSAIAEVIVSVLLGDIRIRPTTETKSPTIKKERKKRTPKVKPEVAS